jgi:chaperone required for assembly of F1-ATPase
VEAVKRFWREAAAVAAAGGFEIALDGRPVKTPKGQKLVLPTSGLAAAVSEEWNAVEGELKPAAMPMTGLANAAIDIVAPDRAGFAASLARYAESDLTCYRADGPQPLVARQVAAWEPVLKAVEARHGLLFRRTAGVMHVAQPEATAAAVATLLAARAPFELAPMQTLVTLSGSVVLALAVLDGALAADAAFEASVVDERWQAEQWGEDDEAAAALARRQAEFAAAGRFLLLAVSRDGAAS